MFQKHTFSIEFNMLTTWTTYLTEQNTRVGRKRRAMWELSLDSGKQRSRKKTKLKKSRVHLRKKTNQKNRVKRSVFLFIQHLSISRNTQLFWQLGMNDPLIRFFQLNDVILCQGKAQISESQRKITCIEVCLTDKWCKIFQDKLK